MSVIHQRSIIKTDKNKEYLLIETAAFVCIVPIFNNKLGKKVFFRTLQELESAIGKIIHKEPLLTEHDTKKINPTDDFL